MAIMRKIHLHLLCGLMSAACVALLLQTAIERSKAVRINRFITDPGRASSGSGSVDEPAEATLARGILLAREGDGKGAEQAYQRVLQHGAPEMQRLASYNLANLQLRQAMQLVRGDPLLLPQVELAKQQYRDVLAADPVHWDARYNLERALWLVPEIETRQTALDADTSRERAATTMMVEFGDRP
jgi:mxaK protein